MKDKKRKKRKRIGRRRDVKRKKMTNKADMKKMVEIYAKRKRKKGGEKETLIRKQTTAIRGSYEEAGEEGKKEQM